MEAPITKFDGAMEEVEDLDGHALNLTHKLAMAQRENMDMQMAISVLQEKVQRMEAKGVVVEGSKENQEKEVLQS